MSPLQKMNAKNIQSTLSSLPTFRAEALIPSFSNTDVDIFGPIYIKQRQARLKRWGCLITCLNTKAIHLKLVERLETDSFINSLRFNNCKGSPKKIVNNCGTNFKGTLKGLYFSNKHEQICSKQRD